MTRSRFSAVVVVALAALALVVTALGCGDSTPALTCTVRADCNDPHKRCSEGTCVAQQCATAADCGSAADNDCIDGACLKHCANADIGKGCATHEGGIGLCTLTTSGVAQCYPSCDVGKTCAFPFTRCESITKTCDLPAGW